jgi:hypothetical protein
MGANLRSRQAPSLTTEAAATADTVEVEHGEAHGDGHRARWRLPDLAGRNLGFTMGDGV